MKHSREDLYKYYELWICCVVLSLFLFLQQAQAPLVAVALLLKTASSHLREDAAASGGAVPLPQVELSVSLFLMVATPLV